MLGVAFALTAQTSVELSVPRRAYAGQPFSLTITVNNPDGNVATPKAPALSGCTLVGGPAVSTGYSQSIINGVRSSSQTQSYTYHYVSDKEGTVSVPAISVSIGGKNYSTSPGQFTVGAATGSTATPSYSTPQQPAPAPGSDFAIGSKDLYMRYVVSRPSVYAQQPAEVSIRLYSSNQQIEGLSTKTLPSFDGCIIEQLPNVQTISWQPEKVGDRNMYYAVVYRALIYPQRPGEIKLGGGEYQATAYSVSYVRDWGMVRPVTQSKEVTLRPQETTLKVNALPQPQPGDFSGAVGNFSVKAELVGNSFKTNEAAQVVYTISGTGNIKFITAPRPDFPAEFELYEPNVNSDAHVSGTNMTGTQTIEYTFVPQSVGTFKIGDYALTYFNPTTAKYETATAPGFEIEVAKGADVPAAGGTTSGKQDVTTKNTDIHHIKPGANKPAKPVSYIATGSLYWAVYPILLIAFIAALFLVYRLNNVDLTERRLKGAGRVARKRLSRAGKYLKAKQYDAFYDELLRAMQSYLADKMQIPVSQLNRDKIQEKLAERGADDSLRSQVIGILDDCEMARYTPQASGAAEATYEQARLTINSIENIA